MRDPKRTILLFSACTAMTLSATSALAHDGPHQLTYLQWLLHELAYADTLPLALAAAVAAASGAAAWRLLRRKSAGKRV